MCVPNLMSQSVVDEESPRIGWPPQNSRDHSNDILEQQCFRACFNDEIGANWVDATAAYQDLDETLKITGSDKGCHVLVKYLNEGTRTFAGSLKDAVRLCEKLQCVPATRSAPRVAVPASC